MVCKRYGEGGGIKNDVSREDHLKNWARRGKSDWVMRRGRNEEERTNNDQSTSFLLL